MMPNRRGFTLIELLVVVSILLMLVGILAPTVGGVTARVQMARCQANLQALGAATAAYAAANDGYYFAGRVVGDPVLYYWGTKKNPVQTEAAPLTRYVKLKALLCPAISWGEYVPEAGIKEPTTTYGYNAFCLDPPSGGNTGSRKTLSSIFDPSNLFVFVDAAAVNAWSGGATFQNNSFVDPPSRNVPMTHFRHTGISTNALCADGHAQNFAIALKDLIDSDNDLSFVGTKNRPHYDNK